jgi:hypothetical protein
MPNGHELGQLTQLRSIGTDWADKSLVGFANGPRKTTQSDMARKCLGKVQVSGTTF